MARVSRNFLRPWVTTCLLPNDAERFLKVIYASAVCCLPRRARFIHAVAHRSTLRENAQVSGYIPGHVAAQRDGACTRHAGATTMTA